MYVADSRASGTAPVSAEPAVRPPAGRRRAVGSTVFALGTVSLITDASSEMVTAVLPLYLVAGLGLSPLGFGLLDGVYNGFSALVRLVGGRFADSGGGRHKTVAVIGYGLSALCKPLLLLAGTLPLIGAVLAADRTGKGLRTAPRDALISLSSTPETRGRAFGVHRAMDTAGALLGPLVAFVILRWTVDGYDAVFTVSFCVAALGVVVLLLFVPRTRGSAPDPAPRSPEGLHWKLLARPTVCATLLGLATVSDAFVYLILQRQLGVPERWFALLPLGTAAAFLLLAAPLGRLSDRVGAWPVFVGGHVALLAVYALLLTHAHSPALPCAVLLLHGTFYAATDGVLMAAASAGIPEGRRSSGLAVVQTGQAAARFGCSLGFGAAWTAWGDRTAVSAAAVLLIGGVTAVCLLRPAPTKATA
ncbi:MULTISPECIES: MFS transporter [unclassified Streptomyces]|uniref:MFS transporter n=1 Tax=unclassified Streptomyces TaxID=2593676 RepID=UPI000DC60F25|nr:MULTISPECIES: MFS transporter [unclassified Streptomyces]RAJ90407.1 putative MFS family arabinose efflux permease [Streptomyces sp. PsTaAH-137]